MVHATNTINDRKIKVALSGCGRVAASHLDAIQTHANDLQLVSVCDAFEANLNKMVEATGAKGYTDYKQMLKETDADVIILCTPSGMHARQAVLAAQAGKHVLTEKPMATRWRDALRMIDACDDAGVRLFVVKQNRFNAPIMALKKALDEERFGRVYMLNVNVFWMRPQGYYDLASWRGKWESDGGALMNQASHYVDMLHWLGGPVESLQAMSGTLDRAIEAEDTMVLNVKWRSGTLGSMAVTMLTYPENLEGSVTVIGEKGTVRVGGIAMNKITEWQFSEERAEDKTIREASYETESVYGKGHIHYYKNVIDVMRGEDTPITDGRSGLKALELIIAAYRSARDGVKLGLPLDRDH